MKYNAIRQATRQELETALMDVFGYDEDNIDTWKENYSLDELKALILDTSDDIALSGLNEYLN